MPQIRNAVLLPTILVASMFLGSPRLSGQALTVEIIQSVGDLKVKKKGTLTKPVVEVRDENNNPVAGAFVTFTLRQGGAGAQFESTNSSFAQTRTDSSGRASADLRVTTPGEIHVNVAASVTSSGPKAAGIITGTATAATAAAVSVPLIVAIVAAVGGGAALAVAAAGGGSPEDPRVPPRTTISPGRTAVGLP